MEKHCRFDGQEFLQRLKGKKIMFIGDSVSVNQRQSLLCLLHAAVPDSKIKEESTDLFSTTTFLVNELASPIKFSLISFSFLMNLVIKFHILFGLLLSPKVKTS